MRWLVYIAAVGVYGCSSAPKQDFKGFEALQGKWQSGYEKEIFYETWEIQNGRMCGTGYLLNEGDTAFSEKLVVEQMEGKLVYIARPGKSSPVRFTCIAHNRNTWVFENKANDFPQRIKYTLHDKNLEIVLSAKTGSKSKSEKMIFEKK